MKRIVVVGATGLIGRHLVTQLRARGDDVVGLSRQSRRIDGWETKVWDPTQDALPDFAREGVDAIANLAGTGISEGRWNQRHRRQIVQSRVVTTRKVVAALGNGGPTTLVNGSAIGFYGPTDEPTTEASPSGSDFLSEVCQQWEDEAQKGEDRARVVRLRTGIVLANDGGALPRLLLPARLGIGGPLGNGRQWMSWIHIDDEIGAIIHCIDDPEINGPMNATAPHPERQRAFAKALGKVLHRPAVVRTPGLALRILLGGAADIAITGQLAVPEVLTKAKYSFLFPDLQPALENLVG